MTPDELADLRSQLVGHEGLKLRAYVDTVGKITVGVGRNLTDKGLSPAEATMLMDNDITEAVNDLVHTYPWFLGLSIARRHALIDMRFNLGQHGVNQFQHMIAAISAKDYDEAARQMLASKWATQVGHRADDLASMMRKG